MGQKGRSIKRNKAIKERSILKELKEISRKSFERYSKEDIDDRSHDVHRFLPFHDDIRIKNEALEQYVDRLWNRRLEQ